jgi:homopolymeric O-antigen transport system ATP-binding protein
MSHLAIEVTDLGKRYLLDHRSKEPEGLRHVIERTVRNPVAMVRRRRARLNREPFWALRDVSFAVPHGEALAIVGRNGAGKSTLLKLLSRITEPSTGRIWYRGRVSSLLEVGTGFHPELTGRENIYLNAAILGMRKADIERRFDEIVAFAEVEQFLDTPVKRYSSGMYVRLAFGVAAHLEPEILLVDEVLAVGDARFQQKCLGKMGSVVNEGRTVLFVSHNMAAVSALCTRAVLLEEGRLTSSGDPQAIIEEYLARSHLDAATAIADRQDRRGEGKVRLTQVTVLNQDGQPAPSVSSGQDITIALDYDMRGAPEHRNVVLQIAFFGLLGQPLFNCLSRVVPDGVLRLLPGGRILCRIPRLPLLPGVYTCSMWIKVGEVMQDDVTDAAKITVVEGDYFGTGKLPPVRNGEFLVQHQWSVG